jgi:hypothetical protein
MDLEYLMIKQASQKVLNDLLSLQGAGRGHNRRPYGLGLGYMAQNRRDGSGVAKIKAAARTLHQQGKLTTAEYKKALSVLDSNCKQR